jgi:hypothetical protein
MNAVLAILNGYEGAEATGTLYPAAATRAAAALGVDGISAGLGTGPEGVVLAWGREATSVALEDLQFTLGQGPGLEAVRTGAAALVPDLTDTAVRWPAFCSGAADLGVRAVFAFPLRIGATSVGVLTAHRETSGSLNAARLADAAVLTDAITILLTRRASSGPPGPGPARPSWAQTEIYHAQVHQATGMISVQLGVTLAEALVRLRAHAYGNDRPLAEVAADVVDRRLRFEDA